VKKLSARQAEVLGFACAHGHLSQGCRTQSDYGGLACTLASLRRRYLLNVMDEPTELGWSVYAALRDKGGGQ
jgi:hypothetical protein